MKTGTGRRATTTATAPATAALAGWTRGQDDNNNNNNGMATGTMRWGGDINADGPPSTPTA